MMFESLGMLPSSEDEDDIDYTTRLLPEFVTPFLNEADIEDDPNDSIHEYLSTLYPEDITVQLFRCRDILKRIGRDAVDLDEIDDLTVVEFMKGLEYMPCRSGLHDLIDRCLPNLRCHDDVCEQCPRKLVIDIKVCPDDGQA